MSPPGLIDRELGAIVPRVAGASRVRHLRVFYDRGDRPAGLRPPQPADAAR